ncbi:hypothetical protein scyTo_0026455 [Scyliorhinus torazame]|uniref:Uncharacterized protein n=1 Tax=Scyliorhinus torazame TaxID=75743 RepID=A0A401QKB7_SCYTO|nr:hypothetical protein [Scyliorhinus torazame]
MLRAAAPCWTDWGSEQLGWAGELVNKGQLVRAAGMEWGWWQMEGGSDMQLYVEVECEGLQDCELFQLGEVGDCPPEQLLLVPEAEMMSDVLDLTLGPLPMLAPVRKFKRQPAGHYDPSTDVQDQFGKRRAANARERHRVRGSRTVSPERMFHKFIY